MAFLGIAIAVIAAVFFVTAYNKLIRCKNLALEAWSNIDVQLKRRHDVIPKLLDVVKGYSRYERSLLEALVNIRTKLLNPVAEGTNKAVENDLSQALKSIFAVAENYPELKANESFLELQRSISEIEDQIQYARRYYNGAVRDYNISIDVFPAKLVAMSFGFRRREYFELEYATERQSPDLEFSQ
jgi:LemA protein